MKASQHIIKKFLFVALIFALAHTLKWDECIEQKCPNEVQACDQDHPACEDTLNKCS